MAKIKFNVARCKGCGLCVPVCPKENVGMSKEPNQIGSFYADVINQEECTGCGLCFIMCPDLVIEIEK